LRVMILNARPVGVLITVGKGGQCRGTVFNGFAGILSYALENGTPVESIVRFLRGMSCPAQQIGGPSSCMEWIGEVLDKVNKGEYNV